jgi:hypothetical protein
MAKGIIASTWWFVIARNDLRSTLLLLMGQLLRIDEILYLEAGQSAETNWRRYEDEHWDVDRKETIIACTYVK